MTEADITGLFSHLARELNSISSSLATQGVSQIVPKFDGNKKHFREWIKAINKYTQLARLPEDRKKLVALQSSSGPVSGFITRYDAANPDASWDSLKKELVNRFSDVTDRYLAMSMLRTIRQKQEENIQIYAERLISLAEDAFDNEGSPVIERQLIDIFVDGLRENSLKLKVLRDKPDTLQKAILLVTNEQNLRTRLNHRHDDRPLEPMDVSHMRRLRCMKCQKFGHLARQCRAKASVNNVNDAREIVCFNCRNKGHIARQCREQKRPSVRGRPEN